MTKLSDLTAKDTYFEDFEVGVVMRHRRGQIDREKAAGKARGPHPRQVEVALAFAGQEDLVAPRGVLQQAQQKVVVAIEDRDHAAPPAGASIRSAEASNRLRA